MANLQHEKFKKECIDGETDVEGGHVNDPNDLGKETNHGITIAVAVKRKKDLIAKFGWDGTMVNLSKDMAYYLYGVDFWDNMYLDQVCDRSYALARTMFRWGLKSGSTRPVSAIQESLNCLNNRQKYWNNIVADGYMGPTTLKTIDALLLKRGHYTGMSFLVAQTNADQMCWMKEITLARAKEANEKYYWGWNIRCIREVIGYVRSYYIKDV